LRGNNINGGAHVSDGVDGGALPQATATLDASEDSCHIFHTQAHLLSHILSNQLRQQLMVEFVDEMVFTNFEKISPSNINLLLTCLYSFYLSAIYFHSLSLYKWRLSIFSSGGPDVTVLLQVIHQQSKSLSLYFKIAFYMFVNKADNESLQLLLSLCSEVLEHFIEVDSIDMSKEREALGEDRGTISQLPPHLLETSGLAPVVVKIISGLCAFEKSVFASHVSTLLPVFCKLIMSDNKFIRAEVCRFFETWGQHVANATSCC
jgi:hypothetical protein